MADTARQPCLSGETRHSVRSQANQRETEGQEHPKRSTHRSLCLIDFAYSQYPATGDANEVERILLNAPGAEDTNIANKVESADLVVD